MAESGAAPSRARSFALVSLAYVAATAAAAACVWFAPDWHGLWVTLAADLVATVVVFAFSVALRNASTYDAYWSVAPIVIAAGWWLALPVGDVARSVLVTALIAAWGVRLTWNWAVGWTGLEHEDWRYVMLREKTGRLFPLVNLGGIHVYPTLLVFLGMFAPWFAFASPAPMSWLGGVGVAVTALAIAIEAKADAQLRTFRARRLPREVFIDEGLWRYSRHPNYFGEQLFWWGLWLIALDAGAPRWAIAGPLAMTALFTFVSIPMMDRRTVERRPAYAEHMKRVSACVPLPRRG